MATTGTGGVGTSRHTLDIGLCVGRPHNEVTPHVDDHPMPGPLVQDPQLAPPRHHILQTEDALSLSAVLTHPEIL